ncbi:hypothetical protein Tco_0922508 [Tanacetum coccineum]|uniref:Uncharacterized protein n=1 Tax=Tanacetum coccineum TaxID=301880 RepID=A0ABQ5CZ95_9ASTR
MHSNVHKVSSINTNCLDNGNRALECLQMENDRLMKLLIFQDLMHTHVNTLAIINDYKSMEQSYLDEYKETLALKAELAKKNDMVKKRLGKLGVKSSIEVNGSKSRSNTKNNRISQTSSSNKKHNKVEEQSRIVKSSLNNVNRVKCRTGTKNMKRIGHDIVQDSIWEQDDDSEEDQEEDGDC